MDITTFFTNLTTNLWDVSSFSVSDILIVLFWTFILSSFIGFVYKKTYKWNMYRQSYVQTIIIMPVIISMIMMIVGSNVATAFTMMWALSIARFRNSLKDTRDLWFIFFAVVVWMAMWIKFYLLALLWTISVSLIIYFMYKMNLFWEDAFATQILKIKTSNTQDFSNTFDWVLGKYTNSFVLEATDYSSAIIDENWKENILVELTYKITNKFDLDIWNFFDEIRQLNWNNQVTLMNT